MHKMKGWVLGCLILCILAAFFFFAMRGYSYISYTLVFLAFLIAVHHLAPLWLRRVVAAITCVGFCYFCFVEGLVITEAVRGKQLQKAERGSLIVLGAAVHGSEPSLALYHRMASALTYLEAFPESRVVVSGGQGKGEDISEAQCMHDWLIRHGVEEKRILMEDRSTSTMENLRFSWEILNELGTAPDDVAVLSSGYHLYRAKSMARSLGLEAVGVTAQPGSPIYTLGMFIREAFGVTHLWILGD